MSNRTWQQELSVLREQWTQTRAAAQAAVATQVPAIEHFFASTVHPAFAALETELAPYREVVLTLLFQYLNYDFGKGWESSILTTAGPHPSAEALAMPGAGGGPTEGEPGPSSGDPEPCGSERSGKLRLATWRALRSNGDDRDEVCYTFHVRLVPQRVIHYTQFRCADFRNGDMLSTRGQVREVTTLADLGLITHDEIIQHFLTEWRRCLVEAV